MEPAELNRQINKALRALSGLGVGLAKSGIPDKAGAIEKTATCIELITDLRIALLTDHPSLDYHYDQARPPTAFMVEIADLVASARAHTEAKRFLDAVQALEAAKALEPPALTYEMLDRQVESIERMMG